MKAKRLLASALALSMAFGAMSALAVTANAAGTPTITVYDASGQQVGDIISFTKGSDINSAISNAPEGGKVVLSEGTFELETGISIQPSQDNITLEGAGSGKTIITAKDSNTFVDNLDDSLSGTYNYRHFFEVIGNNITLREFTLDGTNITGTYTSWSGKKPINFVPLRISYGKTISDEANVTLDNMEIRRSIGQYNKGCIQIGSEDGTYKASVTANNLYIDSNAGESNYADIDICENCSLEITSGGFNGIVLGTFTAPDVPGYYSATISVSDPDSFLGMGKQTLTLYTTIPYLLNAYENNAENLKNYIGHFDSFTGGKDILNDMAGDLADMNLQLYGYTCDEKKALAQEFNAAIDDLNTTYDANISFDNKNTLITALEKADWHTWENEQDTDCNVCGYKREVAPEPEVTTSTATVGEGTEDYDNTFATGFVTTIPSGAEVTSIQWEVTSPANDNTTKKTQVFDDLNLSNIDSELKLGLIINGLNDKNATATAIINPAEVTE